MANSLPLFIFLYAKDGYMGGNEHIQSLQPVKKTQDIKTAGEPSTLETEENILLKNIYRK